jgi:hypothetical protein
MEPAAVLLLARPCYLALLLGEGTLWCTTFRQQSGKQPAGLGWTPSQPASSTLHAPPLSWLQPDADLLELAAVREDGNVCWSLIQFKDDGQPVTRMSNVSRSSKYQAAALVRPALVAAVGTYRIDWLRGSFTGFAYSAASHVAVEAVVACFASHETRELLVVSREGVVMRVPVPR